MENVSYPAAKKAAARTFKFDASFLQILVLSLAVAGAIFWLVLSKISLQSLLGGGRPPRTLEFTIRSVPANTFKLMVNDSTTPTKQNWKEAGTIHKPVTGETEDYVLRYTLPDSPVGGLRLYLGEETTWVNLQSFRMKSPYSGVMCTADHDRMLRMFPQFNEWIKGMTREAGGMRLEVTGKTSHLSTDPMPLVQYCPQQESFGLIDRLVQAAAALLIFGLAAFSFYRLAADGAQMGQLALLAGFFLAVALPGLGTVLGFGNQAIIAENRLPAGLPEMPRSRAQWQALPAKWNSYINDHFGWRNEFVVLGNRLKVSLLKISPSNDVILGQDGWLYYTGYFAMDDFRGLRVVDDSVFRSTLKYLKAAETRLAEDDIPFIVVVTPDKQSITPEFLPEKYREITRLNRLNHFLRINEKRTQLDILDLRPVLMRGRDKYTFYYQTDTHWNRLGAFWGYRALLRRLSERFPNMQPRDLDDYYIYPHTISGQDMASMLGMKNALADLEYSFGARTPHRSVFGKAEYTTPNAATVVKEIDDPSLPTAVIFHDSSMLQILPFLSEHFSRVVYVHSYTIDWKLIEIEKPDLVIYHFTERMIELLPRDNP